MPKECKHILLGPKYAIINPTITSIKPVLKRKFKAKNILLSFGGSDNNDQTNKFIRFLSQNKNFNKFNFTIIVGKCYNHLNTLKNFIKNYKNIQLFYNINFQKMSTILSKIDICIGSMGMSLIERCYKGIGNITISIAENQIKTCKDMSDDNYIIYIGNYNEMHNLSLLKIYEIIENFDYSIIKRAMGLVDGGGLCRISKLIYQFS